MSRSAWSVPMITARMRCSRNGITRYVPVYTTLQTAVAELAADELRRYRRRASAALPAARSSIRRSRELITEGLTAWSRTRLHPCGLRQSLLSWSKWPWWMPTAHFRFGGIQRVHRRSRGSTRGHRECRASQVHRRDRLGPRPCRRQLSGLVVTPARRQHGVAVVGPKTASDGSSRGVRRYWAWAD